jgi:uncharacterized membrane protein (UPF0127 family)
MSSRWARCGGITYFTVPERLVLQSTGEPVGEPVRRARTLFERTRGLLGTDATVAGLLVLYRTRQVHTFGMAYPIDVIFCRADWIVVHVVRDMKPGRVTKWVRNAEFVVELPSRYRSTDVSPGDALRIEAY